MRRLESVFLSNVMLYVRSIETIVKLEQVNKKCQEALKIIRYYNKRKLLENEEDIEENYVVVKNVFDLFPNIETINCHEHDIRNDLSLFGKVKQIELISRSKTKINLGQEIKDKIIDLNLTCPSLENIQLCQFPNVRKVKIDFKRGEEIKQFLGDNSIRLTNLIIKTSDDRHLDYLKDYKFINNKILFLELVKSVKRYNELKSFANVVRTKYPIDGIDIKETFYSTNHLKIPNNCSIDTFYNLSLFTKCQIEGSFDLRNCKLLEEIESGYENKNKLSIQIEGLKHLKRIENIKGVDCIPSSVTKLSISQDFNYKELLEKDENCFDNIRDIKISTYNLTESTDNKIFFNFKNCTKMELEDGSDTNISLGFPTNIKELVIEYCGDKNETSEVSKITGLKKLSMVLGSIQDIHLIQKMFDNLKQLGCLKTDFVNGIILPSTLTYLELYVLCNADLSQYPSLREIKLDNEYHRSKITLPTKLDKLCIKGDVVVTNSNQVHANKIIFDNSSSQFCEWKSNNIYIYEECEEEIGNEEDIEDGDEEDF